MWTSIHITRRCRCRRYLPSVYLYRADAGGKCASPGRRKIDALDDERTGTTLGHAAYAPHNEPVAALAQVSAHLTDTGVDKSAIHMATLSQNLGIVEDLIPAGADLSAGKHEDQNRTPLHVAVAYGITLLAQVLMRAGSNMNQADVTGLHTLVLGVVRREPPVRGGAAHVWSRHAYHEQRRAQRPRG